MPQALCEQPLNVYGDGTQSRCFADVADVTRAIVQLADQPTAAIGQVFNIGSTQEITIRGLAERVVSLTGSRSEILHVPYEEAYAPGFEDMQRRVPSIDKIAALIGYATRYKLDDTLRRVIEYERMALTGQKKPNSEVKA